VALIKRSFTKTFFLLYISKKLPRHKNSDLRLSRILIAFSKLKYCLPNIKFKIKCDAPINFKLIDDALSQQ